MDEKPYADVVLMSVYKEDADNLYLIDVAFANAFYTGGSHGLSKFGHFSVQHLATLNI